MLFIVFIYTLKQPQIGDKACHNKMVVIVIQLLIIATTQHYYFLFGCDYFGKIMVDSQFWNVKEAIEYNFLWMVQRDFICVRFRRRKVPFRCSNKRLYMKSKPFTFVWIWHIFDKNFFYRFVHSLTVGNRMKYIKCLVSYA